MAILLFNMTKATDRSAAGNTAAMPAGADSIMRHRGETAAGETAGETSSALVERCVL